MENEKVKNVIIVLLVAIVAILSTILGLVLTDNLFAANVPTWTSLSFMMLLTEIENHFGFKFKMMEILKLQNMGAIIDSIHTHVG